MNRKASFYEWIMNEERGKKKQKNNQRQQEKKETNEQADKKTDELLRKPPNIIDNLHRPGVKISQSTIGRAEIKRPYHTIQSTQQ